ncbi:MAG: NUDIX domain-containing protein [Candidatus Dormibacteria bacterium]
MLVVPRSRALPDGSWHGIRPGGVGRLLGEIARSGRFLPRAEVESQPEWQQIIPHLVVVADGAVLAMRRLQAGTERRLRGQVTIGVGGHINAGDGEPRTAWRSGCQREWREEVVCDRSLVGRPVGLIKDDAGAVGQVHLGVLIMVDATSSRVEVRERQKLQGQLTPLADLAVFYLEMETWSQFVYDALLVGSLDWGCASELEIAL